jgi:hypothetical protein
MVPALREALKERRPAAARDLYAAFLDRGTELIAGGGTCVFLSPRTFLAVRQYAALRTRLQRRAQLTHLVDLGPGRFPSLTGEKSACALSVWKGGEAGPTRFVDLTGRPWSALQDSAERTQQVKDFSPIQGTPWAFGARDELLDCFRRHPALADRIEITGSQNITADNGRFVRFHWEVEGIYTDLDTPASRRPHWRPYAKGGPLQRYAGNLERVVDWTLEARDHYASARTATLLDPTQWYREGITYTDLSTRGFHARRLPAGSVFDKAGPALFCKNSDDDLPILGLLNTPIVQALLAVLNSTLHTQVADVRALPVPREMTPALRAEFAALVSEVLGAVEAQLALSETSPSFRGPWLRPSRGKDLDESWAATSESAHKSARRANAAHLRLGQLACQWYGIGESTDLPLQPPPVPEAPDLREVARQWVAVHTVAAAYAAEPGASLNLYDLRRRVGQAVEIDQLEAALGESLRDHILGGAFWRRHLTRHHKSPRVWLLTGAQPRLIPFVHLGRHGVQAPAHLGSRRAWRALFGDDPK